MHYYAASIMGSERLLILHIVQISFVLITCFEFDQQYFGVSYQPFVKHGEDGMAPPETIEYTRKNVETTIHVVAEKFSRILVLGNFVYSGSYKQSAEERGTYPTVVSGEVAAGINSKNANETIKLIFFVFLSSYEKAQSNILLVFETSKKSNKIFPGTVEGIALGMANSLKDLRIALRLLQLHRQYSSQLGLQLGVQLNCYQLVNPVNKALVRIQHQIINQSDFIICNSVTTNQLRGATTSFLSISDDFDSFKNHVKEINPNAEVIAKTGWTTYGLPQPMGIESLKEYWQAASNWSATNKYKIFLDEAFDIPWRDPPNPDLAQRGWWKLKNNSQINSIDGYVEKISERYVASPSPKSTPDFSSKGDENAKEATAGLSAWVVTMISLAVTVTLIGILATAFFSYFKRYLKPETVMSPSDVKDFIYGSSNQYGAGSETVIDTAGCAPYDTSLEIPKTAIEIEKSAILGSGEFGIVFKAIIEWNGGYIDQVALKVTKDNCRSATVKGFLSEIKIMSYLGKHPNIVAIKGAYTAELAQGVVFIATELCGMGSLERYLRKKGKTDSVNEVKVLKPGMSAPEKQEMELTTKPDIPMLDMVRWSYEIACGMNYLEGKHVIHADLAARNILLTSEKVAKITDFGLSRRMYNYTNYVKTQQEPLPWRWMSIEALKQLDFSSKSDVWSYGITLWEIFSQGDTPYPGVSWSQSFLTQLMNGLRPDSPPFATAEIYNIMRDCWCFEVDKRPNFSQLVDFTSKALEKLLLIADNSILYTPINSGDLS